MPFYVGTWHVSRYGIVPWVRVLLSSHITSRLGLYATIQAATAFKTLNRDSVRLIIFVFSPPVATSMDRSHQEERDVLYLYIKVSGEGLVGIIE